MADLYRERIQDLIQYTANEDKQDSIMLKTKATTTSTKNNNNSSDDTEEDNNTTKEKSLSDELMELVGSGLGNYEKNTINMSKNLQTKFSSELDFNNQDTRIFGMPHQFLDTADIRIDDYNNFGYCFAKDIFMERPIVTIMPGTTNFLPDMSKSDKKAFSSLLSDIEGTNNKSALESILASFDEDGGQRYYDFKADFPTYTRYVNLMCRTAAVYLGIGDYKAPYTDTAYKYYDWANYMPFREYKVPDEMKNGPSIFNLSDTLSSLYESLMNLSSDTFSNYRQYTHYYVDPNTSSSETISNTAQKSQLEGMFDSAEGVVKEATMMLNSISDATSYAKQFIESASTKIMELGNTATFGFFNNILGSAGQEVLHGANLIYPEIWMDSEYSKDYSIVVDLVSPYGTDEAIYLNIIVPMLHLLAYAVPRQSTANSYVSPFLVKAFQKGMFSCEMGIVSSISFDKGPDSSWSVNGLPTRVKVTMNIKDLYSRLMMTPSHKPSLFFTNQGMMDYLGSLCGLDLTVPNINIKLETIKALLGDYKPVNIAGNLYNRMTSSLNAKIYSLLP